MRVKCQSHKFVLNKFAIYNAYVCSPQDQFSHRPLNTITIQQHFYVCDKNYASKRTSWYIYANSSIMNYNVWCDKSQVRQEKIINLIP